MDNRWRRRKPVLLKSLVFRVTENEDQRVLCAGYWDEDGMRVGRKTNRVARTVTDVEYGSSATEQQGYNTHGSGGASHVVEYSGYIFRSALEARWAYLFDMLRVRWYYEPVTVWFDGTEIGGYTPDFYLPDLRTWVEIKGPDPTRLELSKLYMLCVLSDSDAWMACGGVAAAYEDRFIRGGVVARVSHNGDGTVSVDEGLALAECPLCRAVGLAYKGDYRYLDCLCEKDDVVASPYFQKVKKVMTRAAKARFRAVDKHMGRKIK